MSTPDYRLIARDAIPVKGDCYDCELTWSGDVARFMAAKHREETGHATFVECKPKEEDAG